MNLVDAAKAGARSYAASYISFELGGDNWFTQGLAGGAGSIVQGGKFGHGFVSAASGYHGDNAFVGAIIGGSISEATGGKFVNGAVTGAFAVSSRNWNSPTFGVVDNFKNNDAVLEGYNKSVEKFGAVEGTIQLTDDLSLDYTSSGSEGFDSQVLGHLNGLNGNEDGAAMLAGIASSGNSLNIFETNGSSYATQRGGWDFSWSGTTIAFNPKSVTLPVGFENIRGKSANQTVRARNVLAHELFHAWQNTSYFNGAPLIGSPVKGQSTWEVSATRYTNQIRLAQHLGKIRWQYSVGGPRVDSYAEVLKRTQ
ncbi:MAG: type III secretion system effector protein [Kangiellaceae bacterium]|nr:type III secretion system effector protein [Kangiellaceae bacterium]